MTNWEYRIEKVFANNRNSAESILNGLGAEGWELVNINKGGTFTSYTFKKPIQTTNNTTNPYT